MLFVLVSIAALTRLPGVLVQAKGPPARIVLRGPGLRSIAITDPALMSALALGQLMVLSDGEGNATLVAHAIRRTGSHIPNSGRPRLRMRRSGLLPGNVLRKTGQCYSGTGRGNVSTDDV